MRRMSPETQEPAPAETSRPERVKAVREFFVQLRKGVKTIGMYRHSPGRFSDYLRPAFSALEELLGEGPLTLKVGSDSFDFGSEPVWAAESGGDNVPGRFFREGVRHLILRPEVSEAELTQLVMVMLSNPERGGADIVTQLMNASFAHLDYIVVEGFTVGDMTEEQVEVEVDQIVDYLFKRLAGSSQDTLAFARVNASDLELKLQGIDQIRGAVFDGEELSAAFKERVQQELKKDESVRLHYQLAQLIFFQLREGRLSDAALATDVFTQLLDGMLLAESVTPLCSLLDQLAPLAAVPGSPAAQLRQGLAARMGEEHRLRRLGDALKLNPALDLGAAARYLGELDSGAIGPLLDVLDGLTQPERRALLVETLARIGRDKPEFFAARLDSEKSQTVHDMIAVIDRANFPDRAKYIQIAMRNPNTAVRMEVLAILATSKAVESVHRFVLDATLDKSPQLRAAAFRALVQLSPLRASQDLMRLPKLPDWDKRPDTEKELVYECLGQTGTPEVLRHALSLLQQKRSIFTAKKVLESKLLAVRALQSMASLQAFKLLQGVAESGDSEAEVAAAARKALLQVRRAMTESARQTAPSPGAQAGAAGEAAARAEDKAAANQLFSDFVTTREQLAEEEIELRLKVAALKQAEADEQALEQQRRKEAASSRAAPCPAPSVDLALDREEVKKP